MLITTGEVDTTILPFREQMGVELGVIQLVALAEERVTDIGGATLGPVRRDDVVVKGHVPIGTPVRN